MEFILVEEIRELAHDFAEAWNKGDVNAACEAYARNAWYISKDGPIIGKNNIVRHYLNKYPTVDSRGELFLQLVESASMRGNFLGDAYAVFNWTVRGKDGKESSGKSFETYRKKDGRVFIQLDATF